MQDSIVKEIGSGKPEAAVIWLHGLGADGNDFLPIVPQLGLDGLSIRFIFPNAPEMPVSINNGMLAAKQGLACVELILGREIYKR